MKLNIVILLNILLIGCHRPEITDRLEFPECKVGLMGPGVYMLSANTSIPTLSTSKNNFSIVIDTNFRAINYDPYFFEYVKTFRSPEKEQLEEEFKNFNDRKQIVWLINKTTDTISLQTAGFDLIAVLEAMDLNNTWKPVEYMRYVFDNFQYDLKKIPPNNASFFKVIFPTKGDFETKFRYKVLGKDKFYYSPEFKGKIDHCNFEQDTTETGRQRFMLQEFHRFQP